MLPTLNDGDLLIYKPFIHKKDLLHEGLIVVIKHPYKEGQLMVKRVSKVKPTYIEIIGDNESCSIDSRQMGAINIMKVKGIVESIIS